ncbi:MAG: DUF1330 domain-containing protein [Alphaproteobacteria bacterium]|nr:DUF1330 domain-containing protein [Alphaproteobacteria bacterium]
MKQIGKLALAVLAGFTLGAGGIELVQAQAAKKPAYVVAEPVVTDLPAFQAYGPRAAESIKAANGHFLARGKPDVKEGAPAAGNIVIIAFDSLDEAEKWYSTPPYKDLIAERQKAANTRLYIVEGEPR